MRAFRRPFVEAHELGYYALAILIVLHLIATVMTEFHEGAALRRQCSPGANFSHVSRPTLPKGVRLGMYPRFRVRVL